MTDKTIGTGDPEVTDPLKLVAEHLPGAPVAPVHGIAAIALAMSLRYHDIATVQDGALYQQYKLEGKNMIPLHLDAVFETAILMEMHLLASSERISKLLIDAIVVAVEDDEKPDPEKPEGEQL